MRLPNVGIIRFVAEAIMIDEEIIMRTINVAAVVVVRREFAYCTQSFISVQIHLVTSMSTARRLFPLCRSAPSNQPNITFLAALRLHHRIITPI